MSEARFWLVWSPSAVVPPKNRYSSHAAASKAAIEMARLHAGRTFYVLEAVGSAGIPAPAVDYVPLSRAS